MSQNIKLPKNAIPNRYEIDLDIDLENFKYAGKETIYIEVVDDSTEIQLNSLGIDIVNAFVENDEGIHIDASVNYINEEEKIALSFEEIVKAGDWKLYINFNATIVDDLRGFYRSSFKNEDNEDVWIATTQFEPTAARMAFPCWDEPEYKSIFSITLTSDENLVRVSNEKLAEETTNNGRTTSKFVDSMRMSTYLVAFVVGGLEITNIGSSKTTDVRIVHRPGFGHQTKFAGEAAIKILDFFETYYGINYPGSKLDLIAIPDFAMGAMENVGAVTFRETLLLIDTEKATRAELSRSVEVVAHELAHMWFGDLVTMKWWDGIWLNEAFASLMEVIASEATYPEFKLWNELNLARSQGFSVDSLRASRPVEFEVKTPEEAEEMFDVLTYQKGSTVLRMFETFIGEDEFKQGVQNYLKKFEYKNTHSSDLWDELTKTSEYNLSEILPTWIKQEGYPLISISKSDNKYKISQNRFLIDGETDETVWKVPLNIKCLETGVSQKFILDSESQEIEFEGTVPFINNGGWSFFHSNYSSDILSSISDNFVSLDLNEKYRFLEDVWMSLRVGKLELEEFLNILNLYVNENEKNIWSLIGGILGTLSEIYDNQEFKTYVEGFCSTLLQKLGSDYEEGLDPEVSQLKSLVCGLYARIVKNDEFIESFSTQFKSNEYEDYKDGNYYNLVLNISSLDKTNSANVYMEKFKNSQTPQIQGRYRGMIGSVSEPDAPNTIISAILDQTIRGADAPYVIAVLLSNSDNSEKAWNLVKENWEDLLKVMPEWTASRILDALPSIYNKALAKDIEEFLKDNPLPSAEKISKQKLERLKANIAFKDRMQSSNLEFNF